MSSSDDRASGQPDYLTSIIDGRVLHKINADGGPMCGQRGRLTGVTLDELTRSRWLKPRPTCGRCMAAIERSIHEAVAALPETLRRDHA